MFLKTVVEETEFVDITLQASSSMHVPRMPCVQWYIVPWQVGTFELHVKRAHGAAAAAPAHAAPVAAVEAPIPAVHAPVPALESTDESMVPVLSSKVGRMSMQHASPCLSE